MANPVKMSATSLKVNGNAIGKITDISASPNKLIEDISGIEDTHKKYMAVMDDDELSFSGQVVASDTYLASIRTAYNNETTISGVVFDMGAAGTYTFSSDTIVSSFVDKGTRGGILTYDCTLKGPMTYAAA